MIIPYLPQDILIEIFARLPTKSVGKCRCLSKSWRICLSTPQFAKFHLTHKTPEQSLILIPSSDHIWAVNLPIGNEIVSRKLNLLNTWNEVAGSYDGLVLLVNAVDEIFLLNPTTMQQVKVPHSPLSVDKHKGFRINGFGYDSASDDYKIVTLTYLCYGVYEIDHSELDTLIDVYSVKTAEWKRVGNCKYDHLLTRSSCGAFVNGAIHWFVRDKKSHDVIVSFDLANEVFDEIPAPHIDEQELELVSLVVLAECLCMVFMGEDSSSNGKIIDVWMMKVYGLGKSWTKFSIHVKYQDWEIVNPLCIMRDMEVVMVLGMDKLMMCNLKTGTIRKFFVGEDLNFFYSGGTFVESLVSP